MPPIANKAAFEDELKTFLVHIKHVILLPLSWWLTLWNFVFALSWALLTLPLRISVSFYEQQVRRRFPWLPSIWGTMAKLFPQGIKLPTFTSLTAGPYKGEGPTGPDLPTLDNDDILASIINGDSVPTDNSDDRSKLESALRKIPNSSPGNLDGALSDVKAAQAGTEKKFN
jgi:hypothetical protein